MLCNELNGIIDYLKSRDDMRFLQAATKEQIHKFETEKGVNLPSKYKEWLLFSDGGECFSPDGIQLYGVAHEPVIDVDNPIDNYIVIGALASGESILCGKSGEIISIYNFDTGVIEGESYSDFSVFLKRLDDSQKGWLMRGKDLFLRGVKYAKENPVKATLTVVGV